MNKTLSNLVGASALAVGLVTLSPGAAQAFSIVGGSVNDIDTVGSSFDVFFDGNVNGTDVQGLSGQATFTLSSFSNDGTDTTALFNVSLTNTSSSPITGSRISSLGFDIDPNISSASSSGTFNIAVLNGSFPNGFGDIELCVKDGGGSNNCQGGGSGGVTLGNTGTFDIGLTWAGNVVTAFDLSNFGVRYQSINSPTLSGASGTGQGTPVPEPLTLLGSSMAFGFATYLKRKLDQANNKA